MRTADRGFAEQATVGSGLALLCRLRVDCYSRIGRHDSGLTVGDEAGITEIRAMRHQRTVLFTAKGFTV